MGGRRLIHPLTLVVTACAATLVVWLNVNYRVRPFIEQTTFATPRDRVDYQFSQLQYEFYKDKALGWPLDAYTTTLYRTPESGAVPHLHARELNVVGTWDRAAAALDAVIGLVLIAGACIASEITLRRLRSKEPLST